MSEAAGRQVNKHRNIDTHSPDFIKCRFCGAVNSKFRRECWRCQEELGE